jgi:hypothetical protein
VSDIKIDEKGEGDIMGKESKTGEQPPGLPLSRCMPCSMGDYKTFLSRLVDRYDGDGVNDMPGLTIPVKHWEIGNEPSMQGDRHTFFRGTEEEFVELTRESYETVKSECPDCQVIQGGAAGINIEHIGFWEKFFELGGGDYVDITNIHYIRYMDEDTLNVAGWKDLLERHGVDKPIWVTECELTVESIEQMKKSFQGALDAGASRVLMTQFKVDGDPMGLKGTNLELVQMCR